MHRPLLSLLLASTAFGVTACGGDPTPGGDVVGSWRALPDATDDAPTPAGDRAVMTFAADGTFTRRASGLEDSTGTYATADGRLVLTSDVGDGPAAFDLGYYADGDQLLVGILTPDDDGDDPAATWSGHMVSDGARVDSTMALRDDGTAHLDQTTADQTTSYDGTWRQVEDTVQATYTVATEGGTYTISFTGNLYEGFLGEAYEAL